VAQASAVRKREIAFGWMKLTYGATAVLGIITGFVMLLAPAKFARKFVGFPFILPEQDPIIYGALASIWLTVGFLCVLAIRAPLKFLPILALQFVYKSCWFLFIFIPLFVRSDFPNWGWASAIGNAIWMALDLKSIPWWYLFSTEMEPQCLSADEPSDTSAAQPHSFASSSPLPVDLG